MTKPKAGHRLNAEQRRAVEYRGLDPLLILAGAGTGKTDTLAHRAAHLVVTGTDPCQILLLTFTRRAADEMMQRVAAILRDPTQTSSSVTKFEWSGTFHAMGLRVLRQYAGKVGLKPNFTIHDQSAAADLIGQLRQDLGLAQLSKKFPDREACLKIYSRKVNARQPLKVVLASGRFAEYRQWQRQLQKLFKAYRQSKRKQNVVDFDDLLRLWAALLKRPALAREIGRYFDHVLVDEYQDTNALQAVILKRLKPTGTGVTVVGDDAQAIYGFRAAKVRNLRDFQTAFTRPAQVIKLEQNYRSTPPILAASNAVIGLAREGIPKTLRATRIGNDQPVLMVAADEQEQAAYIADQVQFKGRGGKKLKDQAVLFKAAAHSVLLESELTRRKIPFVKYGGQQFADAASVKEVVAVLKWAENPSDRISGYGALRLIPGFTPAITMRLLDLVGKSGLESALAAFTPPPKAMRSWPRFLTVMGGLTHGKISWQQQIDAACTWYRANFERKPEAVARINRDLARLTSAAGAFETRQTFIATMMLDPDTLEGAAQAPAHNGDLLTLSTVHQAKGRDWGHVYVLNVIDGCFPDGRAKRKSEIEEERRVLYVAMTRAKDQLTMVMPRRLAAIGTHQGRPVLAAPSPFIPSTIFNHFEQLNLALL